MNLKKVLTLIVILLPFVTKGQTTAKTDSSIYYDKRIDGLIVYPTPDVIADYKGGMDEFEKFVARRIGTTEAAYNANVHGKILITFVVEKDGVVTHIKILKGLGYGLDEKAMDVIKNTSKSWKPAKLHGDAVSTQYTLPIYL